MSNLKSVWRSRTTSRFSTAKPPIKEAGVSLMTAEGIQLDELGKELREQRQTQNHKGKWTKEQPDKYYRAHLMRVMECKLVDMRNRWDQASMPLALRAMLLERYARLLGTQRDFAQDELGHHMETDHELYTRICNVMNDWFVEHDGHESVVL